MLHVSAGDHSMRSTPPPQTPYQLSDSPLFWFLLFGGVAIFAAALIQPKFAQREARLERMYQARQQAAARMNARSAAGQGAAQAIGSGRDDQDPGAAEQLADEPIVSLRSLMLLLAAVMVAASIGYAFYRRPPHSEPSP
jgi:hypothetical protein